MNITMKYGKTGLSLDLPRDLDVTLIQKKTMPVLKDPEGTIKAVFANPVNCKTLREEAKGCRSCCILMCDITRPVPNGLILPQLIKELIEAGMAPDSITVVIATGLHRPNEGAELRELVGSDWVLGTVTVTNHFARRDDDHEYIGTTSSGIEARLNRRFIQADLRIVVGLVEPHFMAGYSGGRKIVAPGIAHEKTIRSFHCARVLEDCKAANCVIEGNPLHAAQMEIVQMVGRCLAVNTVIDEDRRISFVNFGEIEKSHLEAVSFVRPYAELRLKTRFKTVVTSSAGYPLDKTYYQTIKGMVGALDILEPGGDLIIVSACSEGIGSPDYAEAQMCLTKEGPERFLRGIIEKKYAAIDEWQTEMQVKAMKRVNIFLYTEGLTKDQKALTGVTVIESPLAALTKSVKAQGDRRVAVIPEGPYVIPLFEPGF
ncbi:MAG TPA: nickel-dependent lactate racemase [Thermodesulfovibrionales bacterium]|nr:nickel-dependent lactate racemase [Thermodesulfovibrionales bacterium]